MFCEIRITNDCLRFNGNLRSKSVSDHGTVRFLLDLFDILQEMSYNISYMHNRTAFA